MPEKHVLWLKYGFYVIFYIMCNLISLYLSWTLIKKFELGKCDKTYAQCITNLCKCCERIAKPIISELWYSQTDYIRIMVLPNPLYQNYGIAKPIISELRYCKPIISKLWYYQTHYIRIMVTFCATKTFLSSKLSAWKG